MKHKPDYAALIQEYEKAGMKQRAFCSLYKIKYPTFQYWLSRVRKKRVSENRFLPVRVLEQDVYNIDSSRFEIYYLDGTVLKLSQASAELVREFLPAFKA